MKYTLFGLFLILALHSSAQEKKDTKVIVAVKDTSNLFKRLTASFYDHGYAIEQKDQDVGFLATAEKQMTKTNTAIKLRAQIKDSSITFTCFYALNSELTLFGMKQARTFDPLEWRKSLGLYTEMWNEMVNLAKQFGTEIKYAK